MNRKQTRKADRDRGEKNMKPVTMDILSAIWKSTLQVGSGHEREEVELANQKNMARKIVGKYGIADTLAGFFYAYLTMSKEEIVMVDQRTGRIRVQVGDEQFALRPFFRGLDAYMYERWGSQMEALKMRVVNSMIASDSVTPQWGMSYLNFPYDPERTYQLDAEARNVEVDLDDMPEGDDDD